ncbi:MAG: NADP-dependent oxidoreductase [Spongiibacteraceae bacterium]
MVAITESRRVVLARRPHGNPVREDFAIEKVAVPAVGEGEVLLATRWISVDPLIAIFISEAPLGGAMPPLPVGALIPGSAVSEVLASRHSAFTPGDFVEGRSGWQEHAVVPAARIRKIDPSLQPEALGILGLAGFTAWCGLKLAGDIAGKTILISGASGAVGSIAGQLANLRGAKVIGIAGSAEKCKHLTETQGFESVINRDDGAVASALSALTNGVDVYFDNVGGELFYQVLPHMKRHGIILICGLMAQYAQKSGEQPTVDILTEIMAKGLSVLGFSNTDFMQDFEQFQTEVAAAYRNQQIKYDQNILTGLAGTIEHMSRMFSGNETGKRLVVID